MYLDKYMSIEQLQIKDFSEKLFAFYSTLIACLHDQNKSGVFGGPAFIRLIKAI